MASTDQSTDRTYNLSAAYSGNRAFPDLPGDVKFEADGGASLLLGKEGLVVLKAAPMAQIILGALMNFIRIVCREFEIVTDFGTLRFSNGTNGFTGFSIEGGSQYADETNSSGGTATARLFIGTLPNNPDARLGFSVNSTDSSQVGGFVVGKDGSLTFGTSKDYLLSVGGKSEKLVQGNSFEEVNGNFTNRIDGKLDQTINSKATISTNGKKMQSVGSDYQLNVNGELRIAAGSINLSSCNGGGGAPAVLKCSSLDIVKA